MFSKFKGFYQYNQEDCGAACLASVLYFFKKKTTISILRNEMSYDKNGANVLSITEVAQNYGLKADAYEGNYEELHEQIKQKQFKFPMIVHIEREHIGGHFLVLKKIDKDCISVFDPRDGNLTLSPEEFISQWTGIVICFEECSDTIKSHEAGKILKNSQRYLNILMSEKKLFISTIFLSLLISIIAMLGAWIYKIVIDNYILKAPQSNIGSSLTSNFTLLLLSLLFFYFFQAGLLFLKNILVAKTSNILSNKLSESFLKHLIKIPEKNLFYFETGEILSRFQSIIQIQQSYLKVIFTLTTELIGAILGGIILFVINSQLFFYVVLMVLVYAIIFMIFLPFLKKNRKKYYSYYSESITALSQVLVGNSTILMQKSSLWFFDKISSKVKKANRKLYVIGWLEGAVSSLVTLTESMGSLAILWKGSQLALQGKISLGSLVVFQSMMTSFILPIQQLILIQNEIQTLRILTQRLDDLYEVKAERIALPIVNEEIVKNYNIKLNNISFSYHFGRNILENINCDISEGSKVGIVGNSGSGKTTLIKMIASLYSPTQGEIYFDNKSYEKYSLDELRQNIAYVDQTPFIFEGTILDNLIMGISLGDDNSKHIEKVAEICELYHLDSTDKNDLNMFLYENGNNLSGGQKQKIGLARALIKSPKLLLLDEATSNIDETSKLKILSYIYSLTKMTVISISHDKSIYNYSDYFLSVKPDGVRKISLIN